MQTEPALLLSCEHTCISIDKDGICLHILGHGFHISEGPSFIACIIVRGKWSSLWCGDGFEEEMNNVYTDFIPYSPSPGV